MKEEGISKDMSEALASMIEELQKEGLTEFFVISRFGEEVKTFVYSNVNILFSMFISLYEQDSKMNVVFDGLANYINEKNEQSNEKAN